jgi:hypothetical protein
MATFVESLIDGYEDQGFGRKIDETTIASYNNDTEVSFDAEYDGDDVSTLDVYSNGTHLETFDVRDDNFVDRLSTLMSSELDF